MAATSKELAAQALAEPDDADEEYDDRAAIASATPVVRRGRGRPRKNLSRISPGARSLAEPTASATDAPVGVPDGHMLQAWMQSMEKQMQQLVRQVKNIDVSSETDEDSEAEEPDFNRRRLRIDAPPARNIPKSQLLPHIPRQDMIFWDNHPAGTPIPYKDLPGQLRQAMDKNVRDRLEVQNMYTALTLSASLLDVFMAITEDGQVHHAQLGLELILNHLSPLLARRVDALQQDGSLRSVFMSAVDPRSQYFIADPDTSFGILQKVSAARVQALMTKAGRRDEDADRRSTSRGNNSQQRHSGGGSQRQRARDRSASSNANGQANGNSHKRGPSRERAARERGSRDGGPPSSSAPAGGEERRN
jgi:hypothetical protein